MQRGIAVMGASRFTTMTLALAAVLATATSAAAVNPRVERACKNDYLQFCPSYEVGTPQLRNCMRQAGKRLSPRCIDALRDAGDIPRSRRR